ncbi:O-antigen ligase family protein [Desulfoluna spongiiphila]|uniref:O-Antigen ligase n=1 Tax=Desulfoluna spongiiphila TaxID=419481 RepID=A0A1G5EUE1_9BACT|nr:O-antigen ligase family protein [Desulfoluna spongiiphila]SCY30411.1 O-Antigen ligase [Desulfoluna spongiiphila]VVS91331.1 o-antigen ligase-related [Desulfoluna spongiiphila]
MDKIVLFPLIISALLLATRSPREVFILSFLPALTFFPAYFNVKVVSGVPELYFWSAALVPILGAWAMNGFDGYDYHWMDLFIFAYVFAIFFAQWSNSTYKISQKIVFNNLMGICVPYMLVRSFAVDRTALVSLIRAMTVVGAVVAFFNALEFRMFINHFDEHLRRLWPTYVVWDTGMVMSRWGFKRALGPFSHPIVAGYVFALIAPLAIWCQNQGHYPTRRKGQIIVGLNILGIFVSISRAPIIGFLLGLAVIYYGWNKNRATILTVVSVAGVLMLMVIVPKFIDYISVTRATATTEAQRNVAYRKEMWEAYSEVVMERPYAGWGRFNVPSVKGMKSIDAEYLGVALASGVIALSFYLVFLFGMLIRMIIYAQKTAWDDPWGRLAWCLIAGWVCAIFSQATVYSGAQSVQYLYMLAGIGQILILTRPQTADTESAMHAVPPAPRFGFARVL